MYFRDIITKSEYFKKDNYISEDNYVWWNNGFMILLMPIHGNLTLSTLKKCQIPAYVLGVTCIFYELKSKHEIIN